jgi:hypothetical protein
VCIFVIGYVWQNIEVMRVKMNYRRLQAEERTLVNKNGRLVYEIERMRSYQSLSRIAQAKGYKKISISDIDVILLQDANGKKSDK